MTPRRVEWRWPKGAPGSEPQRMLEEASATLAEVIVIVRRKGMLEQCVIVIAPSPDRRRMAVAAVAREKLRLYPWLSPSQREWLDCEECAPGAIHVFLFSPTGGTGCAEILLTDLEEN